MAPISIAKFILASVNPFRWWIAGKIFSVIVWAVHLSLSPYALKLIIDRMLSLPLHEAYEFLIAPALFYISVSFVFFIAMRLYDYVWLHINPPLKRHIGLILMERMTQHAHHLFQNTFSGSLGNKIKDVMSGVPDVLKIVSDKFFGMGLALFIAIGTAWTVSAKFSMALSIWVIVFMGASFLFSKKAHALSDDAAEVRSTVVGNIVDILSNMINVRLFATRKREQNHLGSVLSTYVKADQKRDWFFFKMNAVQGGSFVVYQAVILFWLIEGFQQGTVSPGDFILILTISISMIDFLWSFSKDIMSFAELTGTISQGLRITLSPLEIKDKPDAIDMVVSKGEIVFSQVHFRYRDTEALFENKSITISPGQKIGLVGYSGSGKTTFVNLILRLFDVTGGHILIDGQDIRDVTQNSLHKNIGMIPQDPSLFHRSLLENIRYGRLDATDAEVFKAAQKAFADEFITKLPYGYNSLVGERGVKLSGGQRQRVAIARVILKDAPILLLDEATSQLDSLTERYIQNALWKIMQGKTTIVVAHRLSTLLNMDRILVFDHGKIIEDGPHEGLLAHGGLYKKLWDSQVGGFLPELEHKEFSLT